jgi:hypothetical protein
MAILPRPTPSENRALFLDAIERHRRRDSLVAAAVQDELKRHEPSVPLRSNLRPPSSVRDVNPDHMQSSVESATKSKMNDKTKSNNIMQRFMDKARKKLKAEK